MYSVTVVIPVYNAGEKLRRCVDSVLKQSCGSIEVILVDDGSTDESPAIGKRYTEHDRRVRLISQPHAGSIAARRRGIELASSPYVTFVDADDWVDERLVERLLEAAKASNSDIAVCNTYRVIDGCSLIRRANKAHYFAETRLYEGERIREELVPAFLRGDPFPASLHGKLYRRELLLGSGAYLNRIRFFGDDLYYNLEMFLKAHAVRIVPEALYYYRTGGLTSRHMPDLFADMVSGYGIQKEIAKACYGGGDRLERHYAGIRLMLLHTLRSCLSNLFLADLTERDRLTAIRDYCAHPVVRECLAFSAAERGLPSGYMRALREGNAAYLYRLGRRRHWAGLPRRIVLGGLARLGSARWILINSTN